MIQKRFLALATLTLIVAAFLRLWQLSTYPPGPHYDEAAELLIARSIAFGGARFFPMVEAYQGREVLFYYLSAPFLTLISDSIFSLRVLSVFSNLLTIAASMALGRAMFRGQRGVIVGLVVGVLMTLSFPQVWAARQAFRSAALPLMQSLALLFLFRGLHPLTPNPSPTQAGRGERSRTLKAERSGSAGVFAPLCNLRLREAGERAGGGVKRAQHAVPQLLLAGIFAGADVYTYNASRLFPLWLLMGGIALLWFDRARWRQRLAQGVVFFGALAITAAPMALYAFQRPDVFFGRLSEVTQAENSVTLAESIVLHLKMFFIEGDPYFRYNVAGRPYFTLPEGILLLLGIAVAAYRLTRRGRSPVERTAYGLALIAPLMVIPSVISVGGLPPSHMRSMGMVPLIFVLVAVGAEWVVTWGDQRVGAWRAMPLRKELSVVGAQRAAPLQVGRRISFPILTTAVLLIGAVLVGKLYFSWASSAALFYETDADLDAAARWLVDQHIDAASPVYLAARDKGHPTVMIQPVPPITWIGTDSLFRPPPGETGLYIFPHSAPPSPDWAAWLAPGAVRDLPLAPDGQPAFQAFRMSGDVPLPIADSALHARNAFLTFAGMDAPPLAAGDGGWITTAWRIDAPPPFGDFTPLVQIETPAGDVLFHGDAYMAGTDQWRAGETLMQRIAVRVPPATAPGEYIVRMAWIERASDQYQPYYNDHGGQGAVWAVVGVLRVTRPASFPDPAALPIDVRQPTAAAPGVTLLGWSAPPSSIRPGETLPLTFYWQADADAPAAPALEAALVSADGQIELWRGIPNAGYPPEQWTAGEITADRAHWQIPREQPPGAYRLVLRAGDARIELGQVMVVGVARQFEPPPVGTLVNAQFGSDVLLYGYTLRQSDDKLSLEIIWKAVDNITTDYKVFVHLIQPDGSILAQHDTMPQANAYPTSLWLAGEYVVDTYEFLLSDVNYALRVGLYTPADGNRLPLLNASAEPSDYLEIKL